MSLQDLLTSTAYTWPDTYEEYIWAGTGSEQPVDPEAVQDASTATINRYEVEETPLHHSVWDDTFLDPSLLQEEYASMHDPLPSSASEPSDNQGGPSSPPAYRGPRLMLRDPVRPTPSTAQPPKEVSVEALARVAAYVRESQPPRFCTRRGCKTVISGSSHYKFCDFCRNQALKRRHRKQAREIDEGEEVPESEPELEPEVIKLGHRRCTAPNCPRAVPMTSKSRRCEYHRMKESIYNKEKKNRERERKVDAVKKWVNPPPPPWLQSAKASLPVDPDGPSTSLEVMFLQELRQKRDQSSNNPGGNFDSESVIVAIEAEQQQPPPPPPLSQEQERPEGGACPILDSEDDIQASASETEQLQEGTSTTADPDSNAVVEAANTVDLLSAVAEEVTEVIPPALEEKNPEEFYTTATANPIVNAYPRFPQGRERPMRRARFRRLAPAPARTTSELESPPPSPPVEASPSPPPPPPPSPPPAQPPTPTTFAPMFPPAPPPVPAHYPFLFTPPPGIPPYGQVPRAGFPGMQMSLFPPGYPLPPPIPTYAPMPLPYPQVHLYPTPLQHPVTPLPQPPVNSNTLMPTLTPFPMPTPMTTITTTSTTTTTTTAAPAPRPATRQKPKKRRKTIKDQLAKESKPVQPKLVVDLNSPLLPLPDGVRQTRARTHEWMKKTIDES